MVTEIWVNIGSGNGLLPDGTKPLPEPILTDHQWSPVTSILWQFHKRCLNHQSLKSVSKVACLKFDSNFPGANELMVTLDYTPWGGRHSVCTLIQGFQNMLSGIVLVDENLPRTHHQAIINMIVFIRPFEKRTYYAMAMSVRLSVRSQEPYLMWLFMILVSSNVDMTSNVDIHIRTSWFWYKWNSCGYFCCLPTHPH